MFVGSIVQQNHLLFNCYNIADQVIQVLFCVWVHLTFNLPMTLLKMLEVRAQFLLPYHRDHITLIHYTIIHCVVFAISPIQYIYHALGICKPELVYQTKPWAGLSVAGGRLSHLESCEPVCSELGPRQLCSYRQTLHSDTRYCSHPLQDTLQPPTCRYSEDSPPGPDRSQLCLHP